MINEIINITPYLIAPLPMVYLLHKNQKKRAVLYGSAVLLSISTAVFLKYIFNIPRPDGGLIRTTTPSFPSAHAALAFVIPSFFRERRIWTMTYALLVGLSRLYLGVHYAGDIVGGALIGLFFGFLFRSGKIMKLVKGR
ncbi:MAG: hypothetical protein DRP11_01030 [Candidatus Aenigmatarchaeota archaeon]|nr:MAG: hypothetical protein DRP11_01030 [Candidatus Aenigmarchaeota archaeon]